MYFAISAFDFSDGAITAPPINRFRPVARGDLIKEMLSSYRIGDDRRFRTAAAKVIDEERSKHHQLLADELQEILGEAPESVERSSGAGNGHSPSRAPSAGQKPSSGSGRLRELPSGREGRDLVELIRPTRALERQALSQDTGKGLSEVLDEQMRSGALHAHGLSPAGKLLFVGPPGTGKSTSAEALAFELGYPLARVRLASIVSSLLGETARNLEAVFNAIGKEAWVVVFDEFDAIGSERDRLQEHGELKRVVTSFLQLLENYEGPSLVIAATNHPTMLDEAIWRRFDQVIAFDLPDRPTVEALFRRLLRRMDIEFTISDVSSALAGRSQADIELVCLAAMKHSILRGGRAVSDDDIEAAMNRWKRTEQAIQRFRASGRSRSD